MLYPSALPLTHNTDATTSFKIPRDTQCNIPIVQGYGYILLLRLISAFSVVSSSLKIAYVEAAKLLLLILTQKGFFIFILWFCPQALIVPWRNYIPTTQSSLNAELLSSISRISAGPRLAIVLEDQGSNPCPVEDHTDCYQQHHSQCRTDNIGCLSK